MIPYNKTANPQQLLQKVLGGEKVTFDFPGMVDDRFNFISGFIFRLLSLVDMVYLSEMLLVLLKEILSNCSKANAKRIFFEQSGVDINDAEQYKKLIPQFSRSVLKEWEVFHQQNQKSNYYIHINILKHNDSLEFMVENNAGILPQEWKRIQSKMDSFKKYDDISEAFSEIRDESEGAGLGIFFTLSLLSNAGIPPENYQLISSDGKTQTRIKIPLSLTPDSFKKKFYNRFLNEITELPSFPEHISSLLNLCESDTASVQIIAEHIRRDPSLTAQILKIVNSAGWMTRFR
ncbi:MAG: HDOD domain-containing protein, partial [Leptospiraceae bacterium]|nr:HDOD domain-containing protein [Leptospiraceae bacterium]